MAGVSWAASLDARPAIAARLATVIAVSASSASNGTWAYLRAYHDLTTVALGIAVPIAANLAFEVLLAELRRQVQRSRGLPAPVAVPYPRLIRFVLSPWQTFCAWRVIVLEITALKNAVTPSAHHPAPADRAAAGDSDPESSPIVPATTVPVPVLASTPTSATGPQEFASKYALDPRPGTSRATESDKAQQVASAPAGQVNRRARSEPAKPWTESADPRAVELAQHLAAMNDQHEITGDAVAAILGIDIAPRTGRRLLVQARTLLRRSSRVDRQPSPALRVAGQR
jgi:hypothetical protein